MSRKVYIYGLKNIGSNEFKYIGKTTRLTSRLKEHLKEKPRKFSYHKLNWIKESNRFGSEIVLDVLEITDEINWQDREKFYIEYYRNLGHNLTNLLDGGISPNMLKYTLTYDEGKEIVKKMGILTTLEWRNKAKTKELPSTIPKRPDLYYIDNGWISWSDWLGVEIVSNKNKKFISYDNAREIVHLLNIKSNNEWREICKNGGKPNNIPSNPDIVFKNNGWVSWSDWLGYDEKKLRILPEYLTYEEAKNYVSKFDLKTHKDWVNFSKTNRPKNIPSNPWKYYKEWSGIKEFINK